MKSVVRILPLFPVMLTQKRNQQVRFPVPAVVVQVLEEEAELVEGEGEGEEQKTNPNQSQTWFPRKSDKQRMRINRTKNPWWRSRLQRNLKKHQLRTPNLLSWTVEQVSNTILSPSSILVVLFSSFAGPAVDPYRPHESWSWRAHPNSQEGCPFVYPWRTCEVGAPIFLDYGYSKINLPGCPGHGLWPVLQALMMRTKSWRRLEWCADLMIIRIVHCCGQKHL